MVNIYPRVVTNNKIFLLATAHSRDIRLHFLHLWLFNGSTHRNLVPRTRRCLSRLQNTRAYAHLLSSVQLKPFRKALAQHPSCECLPALGSGNHQRAHIGDDGTVQAAHSHWGGTCSQDQVTIRDGDQAESTR